MKNYILIALTSCTLLTSCKDALKDEAVIKQKDSLINIINERENAVNEFIASFNEIEQNLDAVNAKQNIIVLNSKNKGELNADKKERINAEIKAINELMIANSEKLKQLNSKLNRSDKKNIQLEKTIQLLNNQLIQKYFELTELNERLEDLSGQVTLLQTICKRRCNIKYPGDEEDGAGKVF